MKVRLDQDRCVSSGQCVLNAPAVFDQRDEDGVAVLLVADPDEDQADDVRQAAELCPALAILVEE
ncbi:ferredoxin [Actinoplanes regularis]|uniref:ferredoxin n=1 Tax=Actinoplanes regularis TaxID=52697 RepID=UPI0024A0F939|nr:ferredoxin [Actinoplanes regularis]GLW33663.1 ferredoxin [Actinoplanes regularis]